MHEHTIYSHMPLASLDTCCERHREIPPADHAVASASFTVEAHEYDEGVTIPAQKFAVLILVDGVSCRRGVELTPNITMMLLDQFAQMVKEAVGPNLMAAALVTKVIEKFGAEVFDDESPDAINDAVERVRRVDRRKENPEEQRLGLCPACGRPPEFCETGYDESGRLVRCDGVVLADDRRAVWSGNRLGQMYGRRRGDHQH